MTTPEDLGDWIGATARVELVVTDADTAQALGSGDVPVLATPRLLALIEAATVRATTRRLAPDTTTVGSHVEVAHRAATPVGDRVVAEATLTAVDGRRLTFRTVVTCGSVVVAEATIERVLVSRSRFLAGVTAAGVVHD
jgi:fluoroacetyl-CoA thioesterase